MMPDRQRKPRFEIVPLPQIAPIVAHRNSRATATKSKRILSISRQPSVMVTRELILQRAGFEVHSVRDLQAAAELCEENDFDLVILCHSLPPEERATMAAALRAKCSHRILALRRLGELDVSGSENYLYQEPEGFLRKVRSLLNE